MHPRRATAIPPHKVVLVGLKWREQRLDLLGSKEVALQNWNAQARGRPEEPGTDHRDTVGEHLQSCKIFLFEQSLRDVGRNAR